MPNLPIENVGNYGLLTDPPAYEIPPEAWSRADNINFSERGAEKALGHAEVLPTLLHAPYWLFPWRSSTGFSWLYAGLNRMGRIVGTGHSDVTRFTTTLGDDNYTAVAASLFSGTLLGDYPIWTYGGEVDPPQSWNTANARFEDLPNWPANTFCDILTVVNRHVVALRVKKDGVDFNPRMVKWSQAADPGTYPNSWDETDPATGAGEQTLAETQGEIVTTAILNNTTLIYKEDSVISMRFVGGQNIFAFNTVFSDVGCIARYGVAVLDNAHLTVTKGDVLLHNGVTSESVIDKKNKRLFFNNLSNTHYQRLTCQVRKRETEVWICYPSTASTGALDKALIWNYKDNTWAFRELQDFTYLASGFVDASAVSSIFDDQTATFDNATDTFDVESASPVFDDIVAVDAANTKLYKLNTTEAFDGVPMQCRLERTGLPIVGRARNGEWKIDLDSRKFVRRLHLKMLSTGPVNVYIGGQETPGGSVAWEGPYVFDPSTDSYVDFMLNTKFFAFRLESNTSIRWSLQGYTVDLDVIGEAPR